MVRALLRVARSKSYFQGLDFWWIRQETPEQANLGGQKSTVGKARQALPSRIAFFLKSERNGMDAAAACRDSEAYWITDLLFQGAFLHEIMRKNPGSPAAASVPDSGGAHRLPSSSQLEENDRAVTWDSVNDNEHKPVSRRRSSMACDMCRRKKIKCELKGRSKVCVQCIQHKMRCVFSTRKSKRESLKRYRLSSPGACDTILEGLSSLSNFDRAQHIRYLETRLKQVESLLKAAGVLPQNYVDEEMVLEDDEQLAEDDDDDEHDDEGYWEDPEALKAPEEDMGSRARSGSRVSSASPEGHACRHSQHAFLLRTNNRGEPRYFGRASCLSILSEEGIRWIRAKTGDNSFPNSLFSSFSNDDASSYWRPDVYHDLFASRVFKPLPQRAEVFSLLKDYFRTVNFLFPVYHEGTFMRLVEWQYTQQTCNDAARWASINVMLALAYRTYITSDGPLEHPGFVGNDTLSQRELWGSISSSHRDCGYSILSSTRPSQAGHSHGSFPS
ncbi:hypothetical protein VTN00DRAFT_751 [Thermoascus crustaceus]|uniref:uncharacterized protein n=1 Tax=Thermoascus crustaceus TaxID=5088 RepID=UPI003741F610